MGLDMNAYCAAKSGEEAEYWNGVQFDPELREYVNPKCARPRELAYWRKHPNLHGWMEALYRNKGGTADSFNGIELELTWEDIDELERVIKKRQLPATTGFFFGRDADKEYYADDLEFVKKARTELFCGLKVFYNSSW